MSTKIKKILVFTSGGDAPGMNACIRAVVRTANYHDIDVYGAIKGYEGMIKDDLILLKNKDVANIIHRGGTILQSARSKEFRTKEGRQKAYENLKARGIEGIVAIGGDGTFTGASVFYEEFGIPVIGVPGTIDNDLFGTDSTIGYDTALNTAMEAIDKIRDTADAHQRLFFVEVMGRDAGFIALRSGIAGGAVGILVPETSGDLELLYDKLNKGWERERKSMIVIVAEGEENGGAIALADEVKEKFPHFDTKVTILGHVQRGGNPTCADRVTASQMGLVAVEALIDGKNKLMTGLKGRDIELIPLDQAIKHHKDLNADLMKMVDVLSS
jgi:6-phosphofructokinase 1